MAFDPRQCVIKKVWCGNGPIPANKREEYSRPGSKYECLQSGFGAGASSERAKTLPGDSLQHIKYVGPKHDAAFSDHGIQTRAALEMYARSHTAAEVHTLLTSVLQRGSKGLDKRAYNSVLLYVYGRGVTRLPQCKRITDA